MRRRSLPFRAVLWDIDGTLADSEPLHERAFVEATRALGLALPADFHAALLGRTETEAHAWLVDRCGLELSLAAWTERRLAAYFAGLEDVTPHPVAIGLWHRFEALGLPQGTVSNSDRLIVNANLARLGLDRPGLVSISRNDVRAAKPDPEPYLRGAHLLGLDPDEIAVVEDSATGLRAAQAAGMRVYMMPGFTGAGHGDWQPLAALAEVAEDG
ncbi:HAD family hydrolase [Rhodovulum euryhalinum]|uniref:HAD family hydrolase n=1 Tax=Rhodovulum euryhalinum TaxID=35805 RepID=UPI00140462E0|nr:HAD family phosphatase [Rhodovulum euryhalinum]